MVCFWLNNGPDAATNRALVLIRYHIACAPAHATRRIDHLLCPIAHAHFIARGVFAIVLIAAVATIPVIVCSVMVVVMLKSLVL